MARKKLPKWLDVSATAAILLGLLTALMTPMSNVIADDEDEEGKVLSPKEAFIGKSYGQWSADWWTWANNIPEADNPILDASGDKCGVNQSDGPVFFLAGSSGDPVTRKCCVPAGKALFFPVINVSCDTVDKDSDLFRENIAELQSCVADLIDDVGVDTVKVSLHGERVVRNGRGFRAQSGVFPVTFPAGSIIGEEGVGQAASDGYWILLSPIAPGQHQLHFEGAVVSGPFAGFSQDITYLLHVSSECENVGNNN